MNKIILVLLFILQISGGFIHILKPLNQLSLKSSNNCNERHLYLNYLRGLRKTKNYIRSTSNIDSLKYILNYTNVFINNYTNTNNTLVSSHKYDNTDIGIKNIIIGSNLVLDVSNIKYIHISSNNDNLTIELDKAKKSDLTDVFNKLGNIETLINTLNILNQLLHSN